MNPFRQLFLALSRMPPAVMLLLIVGLAIVVTMTVTGNLRETQRQAAEREAALKSFYESKSKVVYATKDVARGELITAAAIQEKDELVSKIPRDAVTSAADAVGQVARFGIQSGQIVSMRDVAKSAEALEFETLLKPGYRAVTFGVYSDTGVAGFIQPGSQIDIYALVGSEKQSRANAILSDCSVVAVGHNYGQRATAKTAGGAPGAAPSDAGAQDHAGGPTPITIQLEPKSVVKLLKGVQSTSSGSGRLYLTLRGQGDHTPIPIVDVSSLFAPPAAQPGTMAGLPPPPAVPTGPGPVVPVLREIEVWSGSHKESITVPKT